MSLVDTITPSISPPEYQIVDSAEEYLYLISGAGAGTGMLEVFSLNTPSSPASVTTLSLSGNKPYYMGIHNAKKLLFVPQYSGDVDVISIADPSNPFIVATYNLGTFGGKQKNATASLCVNNTLFVTSTTEPTGSTVDLYGFLDAYKLG